jgi:MSHA biogenesis protein MshP
MSRELRSHRSSRTPSGERGVGLPVAIFVITVLAAFVVNMGYLVQDNATGRIEYVQSLRALLAAESGGDFGLNVLFDPSDATTYSSLSCSSTPVSYSFTNDPGMAGCSASVSCSSSSSSGETVYTITSVGTCDDSTRTIAIDAM